MTTFREELVLKNIAEGKSTQYFNKWEEERISVLSIKYCVEKMFKLYYIIPKLFEMKYSFNEISYALNMHDIKTQRNKKWTRFVVDKFCKYTKHKEAYKILKNTTNPEILELYNKLKNYIDDNEIKRKQREESAEIFEKRKYIFEKIMQMKSLGYNNDHIVQELKDNNIKTLRNNYFKNKDLPAFISNNKDKYSDVYYKYLPKFEKNKEGDLIEKPKYSKKSLIDYNRKSFTIVTYLKYKKIKSSEIAEILNELKLTSSRGNSFDAKMVDQLFFNNKKNYPDIVNNPDKIKLDSETYNKIKSYLTGEPVTEYDSPKKRIMDNVIGYVVKGNLSFDRIRELIRSLYNYNLSLNEFVCLLHDDNIIADYCLEYCTNEHSNEDLDKMIINVKNMINHYFNVLFPELKSEYDIDSEFEEVSYDDIKESVNHLVETPMDLDTNSYDEVKRLVIELCNKKGLKYLITDVLSNYGDRTIDIKIS